MEIAWCLSEIIARLKTGKTTVQTHVWAIGVKHQTNDIVVEIKNNLSGPWMYECNQEVWSNSLGENSGKHT
jgi:hypothetical protein